MILRTASIISALTLASAIGLSAQINSPNADGYLLRGKLMLNDRIYHATSDQAAEAANLNPSISQSEQQMFLSAIAALKLGSPNAPVLLSEFAHRWPASARMPIIHTGLGDCYLRKGNYTAAAEQYALAGKNTLAGTDKDDLSFRIGYCDLLAGRYDEAEEVFSRLSTSETYGESARFYLAYAAYAKGDYATALKTFATVNTNEEPGCAAPYYMAQIYYRQEKWDQAADLCRRLLKHQKVAAFTPEATRILGESLWHISASDPTLRKEAIDYLWKYAASVDNPEPSAIYLLGVNEYESGHYSEALGLLQRVIGGNSPLTQSTYLYIGQCYSQTGNTNAALMAYEHAFRLDYSRDVAETALYNYAATKIEGGNAPFASSVKILEDFLNEYPDSRYAPKVENYLVSGYMADNDYEAALAGIERIKRRTPQIEEAYQRVLFMLGTRDYANGQFDKALKRFKAARAIKSSAGGNQQVAMQCRLWEGDCRYALEQFDAAATDYLAYLKQANASDPNHALALYDLGYARFAAQQYDKALTNFQRYVNERGIDAATASDAYCRMGDCRYYANQFSAAAADYRQAYEMNPASSDYALYQLAIMKGLLREHKVKIATIDEMIRAYPGSPLIASAMLEKADSYAAIDNQPAAIDTYTSIIERYPSTAQGRKAMLQLAITYLSTGRRQEAITTYKRVISSYPTSEEASLALDDIKRIYAEDGALGELSKFMATVKNAPAIDKSEYDILAFEAAEKAYIRNDDTSRLSDYLKEYPQGAHRAQAIYFLAQAAADRGDNTTVVELTDDMLRHYPDAESAEEALMLKANAETALGRTRAAFDTYRTLNSRASSATTRQQARLGMMRQGLEAAEWDAVIEAAELLAASSSGGQTDLSEIGWSHGKALNARGRHDEARQQWEAVIKLGTGDVYASRSAVDLAEMLLATGQLKEARKVADAFINSNPSQPYWLARGFITLSDILRRQGETFEADEYLRSLRNNYPGKEEDIFLMIDERLKN